MLAMTADCSDFLNRNLESATQVKESPQLPRPFVNLMRACCRLNRLNYPRFAIQRRLPGVPDAYGAFKDIYDVRYTGYPPGHDHVTKAMFWFGAFDPWVVRTMKLLSGPGSTVCDVGANLGDTALPLANHVGPKGKVICFEPLPENIGRLEANIAANGFSQVILCPLALTDTHCELQLEIIEGQPGMTQIAHEGSEAKLVSITGIPFDDWAAENGIEEVAVCKIDVQGHELSVLAGMNRVISEGKMLSFIFEHEGAVDPSEDIFQFFIKNGYNIYRIENRWFTNVYARVGGNPRARRTFDFVAVIAGSRAEKLLA
jgi:FkbM family methyltransferase